MSTEPSGLAPWKLLRPPVKEGQCPECATNHTPEMPHNQQSLFYQYAFYDKHGRWPTWNDALAHCTPEMRAEWVDALKTHGIEVPAADTPKQPL